MVKKKGWVYSLFKDDIFKVFSLSAISMIIKMLTAFVSVKVISKIIGPSGIALLGQLNNFSTIVMIIACGGINNGVTKYLAELKSSLSETIKLLSTAFKITLICSTFVGLALILFNSFLSDMVMLDKEYGYIFVIFGVTIIFYSLNNLLISILNGFKQFKLYTYVNIIGSLVGLFFSLILVYVWELKGALISAVCFQSVVFFISLWKVRKCSWLKWSYFIFKIDKLSLRRYSNYAVMTVVTAITLPLAQLFLRSNVISNLSVIEAGWWEAMNRLSNMYLMVITTSLSVYYLPRLSEIRSDCELKKEIYKVYKIFLPILIVVFFIIYHCRDLIIRLLFSKDFIGVESLFMWQLIGDFFKISSWILAYLMIAKAMTKEFVLTEILFTVLYTFVGYKLMLIFGVVGITYAYAINYALYLLSMIVLFRKIFLSK